MHQKIFVWYISRGWRDHINTSMSSRPSSGLKSSSKLHQETLRSPPESLSKQDCDRLSQNKSGVKSTQREEPSSCKQVPLQPCVVIPSRARSQAFNFITLGRFQVDSTITRLRICKLILLLTIKILSIQTAAVFWLASLICLKTLLNWQAPANILYELTYQYTLGSRSTTPIWSHIFPATDYINSRNLRLTVHRSSYLNSPIIYSTSIPLIIDDPIVWIFVMVFMFVSHHLLCFAHDCLSKVSPTIQPANYRLT
jgi:hypothetical protein